MENNPIVSKCIAQVPIMGIKLVLLKKIHREIEPSKWTKLKKGIIASEYPVSIYNYFNKLGISEECFTVLRVFGGT